MADFYKFLDSFEALIYIVLAMGGMFSFRWLWRSWNEWQTAVYKLEKEFSSRRIAQAGAISILLLILFCFEFSMTSFIIPGLPAEVFLTTATPDFISTPTGTLSAAQMTQYAIQPPPTGVPGTAGCIPGQLELSSPAAGEEIRGTIDLIGTVNISNFGFYKYEGAPAGSDTWATISAGRTVVANNSLGRWDTTALTPGDYQLRLVATDNAGVALPPCIVPVRVVPPQ